MKKIITYYFRKPTDSPSIERMFKDIIQVVDKKYKVKFYINRFSSKGIFNRIYDMISAPFYQSDINHITGDVHYLSYFLSKKKTLLTIHDIGTYYRLKGLKKFIFWLLWIWLPIKRSSLITTDTKVIKNEILKIVKHDRKKIKVMYAPVCKIYKPSKKKIDMTRIRVLHIGSAENKNLKNHIEALKSFNFSIELVVICKDIKKVKKLLKFVDFRFSILSNLSLQRVYEEYKMCDILLFASLYEGFGLPIIEAQSVGRPVITSNYGAMKEISNGSTYLADPMSPLTIRKGLLKIIKNKKYRDKLIELGFENVKKFQSEKIGSNYSKLYDTMLKNLSTN